MKRFYIRQRLGEIAQGFRPASGKSKQNKKADAGAQVVSPRTPTLIDVADETDSLLAFEINNGCMGEVEQLVDELRRTILENRTAHASSTVEHDAIDRLWVNLLRLGLFDELAHLVRHHNLPLRPEVSTFIDYCEREYAASRSRGETYRAKYPEVDIFTMGCIVWGDEYVGNFLRYNIRSMLSQNNLPALRAQGRIVCSIVTDAAGELRMRQNALFGGLPTWRTSSSLSFRMKSYRSGQRPSSPQFLHSLRDARSLLDFLRAGGCLAPVHDTGESIVADGSLSNMANFRHEGYECCGGGNIVAETETFLPALDRRYGDDGPIGISTHDLATLAARHAHHYFRSQIVAAENDDFGKHPREIFWPVKGGVEIHSVFIHPLFTSASGLAKYNRKHFANVDYGMIPRMISEPNSHQDHRGYSAEAYVNNFTAGSRLYETTGEPFTIEDFLAAITTVTRSRKACSNGLKCCRAVLRAGPHIVT